MEKKNNEYHIIHTFRASLDEWMNSKTYQQKRWHLQIGPPSSLPPTPPPLITRLPVINGAPSRSDTHLHSAATGWWALGGWQTGRWRRRRRQPRKKKQSGGLVFNEGSKFHIHVWIFSPRHDKWSKNPSECQESHIFFLLFIFCLLSVCWQPCAKSVSFNSLTGAGTRLGRD